MPIRLLLPLIVGAGFAPLLPADESRSPQDLVALVQPSIVTIRVAGRDGGEAGIGTGFVLDANGLIATNLHVISEGRSFTVETSSRRRLKVLAVEASDRTADLAVIRVDVGDNPLSALELAPANATEQGLRVMAFGNPLGLRNSVVEGIVSAVREVDNRTLIQLAMPIEPGNSGGPLVDQRGRVHGIVNMKSAIDQNLGFAIPIAEIEPLRDRPNPVAIERWVILGGLDEKHWTQVFGAKWQQRGGVISVRGMGQSFGGRALCLANRDEPETPYEIAVSVKLDDESGAAGLAFLSDGRDRHYGFYPTNGRIRLTCFRGPDVYSWQILEEFETPHYIPAGWNRLRVRIEADRFLCYLNGELVVESTDRQLKVGKFGLVKFRGTNPDFKRFRVGGNLSEATLGDEAKGWLAALENDPSKLETLGAAEVSRFSESGELAARELIRRARSLEQRAERIRSLAGDLQLLPKLDRLRSLFVEEGSEEVEPMRLLRGALLIASLDDPDVDIEAYEQRVERMAAEIAARVGEESDDAERLAALDRYLFKENGFHGSRMEYYHPANSHMNRVIDDREGLPITMSILYKELARRIGLRIEGVGLPGHFVVKHVAGDGTETLIDVFNDAAPMSLEEAANQVSRTTGQPFSEDDLHAQSDQQILSRVLRNLMGIAGDRRDGEALRRYAEALVAINPDSIDFRLMRAQLRGLTDRKAAALEDLDWLLENDPAGLDREAVMRLREAIDR